MKFKESKDSEGHDYIEFEGILSPESFDFFVAWLHSKRGQGVYVCFGERVGDADGKMKMFEDRV